MSMEIVRAVRLRREFGARVAVTDLSLTLHAGELVALVGPNGAGKTTTLRMIAGLIAPTSGEVVLNGVPLTPSTSDMLRCHVGLLTESPGLWDRLSVRLNLLTYARLYGLPRPNDVVRQALALVGLTDRARDPAGALSKGLRQRLAIARALMHEPVLVLLDEPTAGLDPASARQIRDLVSDLKRQGRSVLVSTHNLSEAEELADTIAVLNTALLAHDSPAALRRLLKGVRVEIELEGPAERWLSTLDHSTGADLTAAGSIIIAQLADSRRIPDLVANLVTAGARVARVSPSERTLEEVYLSLVRDVEGAR
jgi:ABC-2 type transport system ATP-binding protein